ncbi:anthrone oxygenase family protein [Stieleria neptunia]|uniref:anthrone oxygenase family protein n=1 Tax=Stieleria neptunia TaxID=2527979 RepID=UPI0036F421ED
MISAWQRPPAYGWAIAGACVYLSGGFMVTAVFNIPLNKALDQLPLDAPESHDEWARYLRLWTRWNHLRTAACILACVLLTLGLA